MTEYKIERWDVIQLGSSNRQYPMIYIKPDKEFLEFIKGNDTIVLAEIMDIASGIRDAWNKIPTKVNLSATQ